VIGRYFYLMRLAALIKYIGLAPYSIEAHGVAADSRRAKISQAMPSSSTTSLIKRLLAAGFLLSLCASSTLVAELKLTEADVRQSASKTSSDWKQDWAVEEGFSISIDTEGYHFPSALAFVPNPGSGPKDPLYFVTELRGKVKVVTNDRSVYTFAEDFLRTELSDEPPVRSDAESGLAGICLAPEQGYLFVTFAYQVQDGTLRNNIIRFETTPETFALKPRSQRAFTEVFAAYESGPSHQVGGCQVSNDMLYVGVGDGFKSHLGSQKLDTLQGKLIRMTLDGEPAPGNPFYVDDDIHKAANYVWAYGLRNPFSLDVIGEQVIVADNGVDTDRFLKLRPGKNYLWNGTDRSIAANADYVFLSALGPVQMGHYQPTSPAFPEALKDQFYVALSDEKAPGIMRIPYDLQDGRMHALPEYVLRYAGNLDYPLTGLAFGPDGLYFTPILPVRNGQGAVMKIQYEPERAHAITLADLEAAALANAGGKDLMIAKGCFGCHQVLSARAAARGGTAGPALGDAAMVERIQRRTSSPEFIRELEALNARDEPALNHYDDARRALIEAEGMERVRLYIKYQIVEPSFDGPLSGMPDLNVSEAEAEAITRFLLTEAEGKSKGFIETLKARVLGAGSRYVAAGAFGAGALFGLTIWLIASLLARRRRA
jgi:glucose/arabinose dehydrogenase